MRISRKKLLKMVNAFDFVQLDAEICIFVKELVICRYISIRDYELYISLLHYIKSLELKLGCRMGLTYRSNPAYKLFKHYNEEFMRCFK